MDDDVVSVSSMHPAPPMLAKTMERLVTISRMALEALPSIRDLPSSTFRLNSSAFCGIEMRHGVVQGVFRRCRGV